MITIAEYKEHYFNEISELLASFRVVLEGFKQNKKNPDINSAKEELRDYINRKWPIYIALVDNKPVGYILLKVDGVVWVEHIYINEEYQRQGIGSLLYKKAEEYSTKLGCDTLFNWVHPNNYKIISFLRSKGYTVLNLIEVRKPFKGEKPHNKIKVDINEFDY